MINDQDTPAVTAWRVSSYSTGQNQCVEVGALSTGAGIAVRDSKNRSQPAHVFTPAQWATFIKAVKHDTI